MSTAQALAFSGARFIKKQTWTAGKIYIHHYDVRQAGDTWCFIHPFDRPSPNPTPVLLKMLEGDDWEEVGSGDPPAL